MKKIIVFLAIIVLIFSGLYFVNQYQNSEKLKNNPYDKENLKQSTIDLLDDPNYQNIVLPSDLEEKIQSGNPVTVYFFSPECPHCKKATPILAPLVKDMGIDLLQYNILEYEQGWNDYNITATPTIIHFENGKEQARFTGAASKAEYEAWLNEHVKK